MSPPPARSRRPRATARATGSGSSRHPPEAYDLYYNVIANPALWFVQHGLWERKIDPERDLIPAWDEGYVEVNRDFADAVARGARARAGGGGLLPRLPPLRRAVIRPRAATGHRAGPLHAHSLGRAGRLVGAAGAGRPRDPRRAARLRRRGLPHAAVATGVPRLVPRPRARAGRAARQRASDLDRSAGVREPGRQRAGAGPRARARGRAARAADPPRRPHRPVEERATGLRGVCLAARAPSRPARPRRHARPARRVPSGDPGVRRGASPDRGGGRRRRGALPGCAHAPHRRRLPGVDRGVQAVRRPARERGHGRAQSRREGGADRERARRCRCLICKRRCVRGAR